MRDKHGNRKLYAEIGRGFRDRGLTVTEKSVSIIVSVVLSKLAQHLENLEGEVGICNNTYCFRKKLQIKDSGYPIIYRLTRKLSRIRAEYKY